jgi:glutathione reductase (NADPH)
VLLAIGRPPNTELLGLENTSVKLDSKGFIQVDEFSNTTQPGVYAVGDVTDAPALTPVAIRAGRILSERLFNQREGLKMNFANVPSVIFSHPPIGTIGLNESEAALKFGKENVTTHKSGFGNMFYSLKPEGHKPQSLFKLICHRESSGAERVVGVHAIGRGVDEMMQGLSIAMNMGATKQDFDNSVAIHPTASEEFVLMDAKFV